MSNLLSPQSFVPTNGSALVTTGAHEATVFNPEVFESLYKIAEMLANSTLVPDTLRGTKKAGTFTEFPLQQRVANCFLVVEQAHRWAMSPFAVAACASVVYGRLMWEGKLIHGVIEAKLGIKLDFVFDEAQGDKLGVVVSGLFSGEENPRTVEGTVEQWKTTGDNSPWGNSQNYKRQLRYRGAREWARAHAPGVIFGVIADDEAVDFNQMKRADTDGGTYVRKTEVDPTKLPKLESSTETPAQKAKAPSEEQMPSGADSSRPVAVLSDVEIKESPPSAKRPWTAWIGEFFLEGKTLKIGTFSKTIGSTMLKLKGSEVFVEYETTEKGSTVTSIASVDNGSEEEGGLV